MTATVVGVSDPLEGLSLPVGDPGALWPSRQAFLRAASALGDAGARQRRAVGAVAGATWKGMAAQRARASAEKLAAAYADASRLGEDVAGVLGRCANAWEEALSAWASARAMADQAMEEEAQVAQALAALQTPTPSGRPPFESPLRNQARRLGEQAVDQFDRATSQAVHHLDELASRVIATPAFLPAPHRPWYDAPVRWAETAAGDVWRGFDTAWQAASQDPGRTLKLFGDLSGMAAGAAAAALGIGGEVAAGALDATGIGAVAGVPLNVAGAGLLAGGMGTAVYSTHRLADDLNTHQARNAVNPGDRATAGETPAGTGPVVIASGKLDYLFGEVGSDEHNLARSLENLRQMERLGVPNDAAGRSLLRSYLQSVAHDRASVVRTLSTADGEFQVRESLFAGPSGAFAKFESTWQVMPDDTLRFISVIPYGGG